MKRIKILTYGVLLVTIGFLGVCYFANNAYPSDLNERKEIDTILSQLNDPNWRVRDGALCRLIELPPYPGRWQVREEYRNDERVRTALINLFIHEVEHQHEPCPNGEIKGEEYAEYESALAQSVVSLKDKRPLPYFLKYGCYDYIRDYIVEVGDESVVRERLKDLENIDPVYPVRTELSIEILGRMVKKEEGYIPTGTTREEIKQAIVRTLKQCKHIEIDKSDPYSELNSSSQAWIRLRTIQSLGNFADPSLIPIIRPYLNDPYSETREKTELRQEGKKATVVTVGKVTIYPVREEAQRVLKLLEEKKKQQNEQKGKIDKINKE